MEEPPPGGFDTPAKDAVSEDGDMIDPAAVEEPAAGLKEPGAAGLEEQAAAAAGLEEPAAAVEEPAAAAAGLEEPAAAAAAAAAVVWHMCSTGCGLATAHSSGVCCSECDESYGSQHNFGPWACDGYVPDDDDECWQGCPWNPSSADTDPGASHNLF